MKNNLPLLFFICFFTLANAQSYDFKTVIDLDATDVISQGNTGTCWSFSTSSFLESEIMRITGKTIDLSEMYNVRNTYPKKAWNYVMRQGHTQFSEGGLAHDVINSMEAYGLVPVAVYSGLKITDENHNHAKLIDTLTKTLDKYIENPKLYTSNWKDDVNSILDSSLGQNISTFTFEGATHTPMSFLKMTKLNPKDYISITSFTHEPFYRHFILNIPDNFSNGKFLNVKIDELLEITNRALEKGYTIALDCDVSEPTFSSKYGMAILPNEDINNEDVFKRITPERIITQELRQQEFENFNTTDDHLMHIIGLVKDQTGKKYYKVKNSWGKNSERVSNDGYIFMSESYFKLKTISIMIHEDGLKNSYKKL
jgi:bleomycin hydrolase